MKCNAAIDLIDLGITSEALKAHLQRCPSCRARRALWALLQEAGGVAPSRAFTSRLHDALRAEAAKEPRASSARGSAASLDEFADFPPESFGQLLFGKLQRG